MTSSEDTKDAPELLNDAEFEARRLAMRENAKHVLWESGLAEMLRSINKDLLKGRGRFEEYDSMVLFKWGSGYTRRHIWVEVSASTIPNRSQKAQMIEWRAIQTGGGKKCGWWTWYKCS